MIFFLTLHLARNRFNIQRAGSVGASSKTTEHDSGVTDASVSTTTVRSIGRSRPTFVTRSRSKPNVPTTSAPRATSTTEEQSGADFADTTNEHKLGTGVRPSRFNLSRPNRLLANRQRPGVKSSSDRAELTSAEVTNNEVPSHTGDEHPVPSVGETEVESSTPALTGLNRLKQRPRIQLQSAPSRPKTPALGTAVAAPTNNTASRKINPLIARRKLGLTTSTAGT